MDAADRRGRLSTMIPSAMTENGGAKLDHSAAV